MGADQTLAPFLLPRRGGLAVSDDDARRPSHAPTMWQGWARSVRRMLEIAMLDSLELDNSMARGRPLLGIVTATARLLEVDQFGPFMPEDDL